jgi:hypothetical protein
MPESIPQDPRAGAAPATGARRDCVAAVLRRQPPGRVVYAPNYWQWFAHHQHHGLLPPDIAHCRTQLDLIRHLGLDVFSRNLYSDQQQCWFGGLAEAVWDGVEMREETRAEGRDRVIERTYLTRRGTLTERQRYVFADSTLVQETFALDEVADPLGALEELLRARPAVYTTASSGKLRFYTLYQDTPGWDQGRWSNSNRRPPDVNEDACHILDAAFTARLLLEWDTITDGDKEAVEYVHRFADRLCKLQLPNGAFPGWVNPDGKPVNMAKYEGVKIGPESAMGATLLLELLARDPKRADYRKAAEAALKYLETGPVADGRWEDFETYFSCSRTGTDEWMGRLTKCTDIKVEGIILKDSWGWTLPMFGCQGVHIDNVKIVSARCANNDGIGVCNSQDVRIENCFIRTDDDCITTKGVGIRQEGSDSFLPVEDVLVERCVLWTDRAHIWRLGCESRASIMRRLVFRNIDVIHYTDPRCWVISVQPAEGMLMEDVRFENIRINGEGQPNFIEVMTKPTIWAKQQTPGMVRNVLFKDVVLYGHAGHGRVEVAGCDPDHTVEGVTFENVVRYGQRLVPDAPHVKIGGNTKRIVFK